MKRKFALVLAIVLILSLFTSGFAVKKSVEKLIPKTSLWTASREDFQRAVRGKYTETKVNKKQTLKIEDVKVEGLTMDGYYMFGANMTTHKGLSKVTYILAGESHSEDELTEAYSTLVAEMEKSLGKADSSTSTLTTWVRDKYKVEIGKGKLMRRMWRS